jgi:hypothetical protein
MKPFNFHHYRKMEMVQDAFIILTPPILMLVGILWFFRGDWIHTHLATVLMSFVDSFLALLRGMV